MLRSLILIQIAFVAITYAIDLDDIQPGYVVRVEDVPQQDENGVIHRLYRGVHPTHYDILIKTKVAEKDLNFNGQVTIDITVTTATKLIELHSKLLIIDGLELWTKEATPSKLEVSYKPEETELLEIKSVDDIPVGDYTLKIDYNGQLKDDDLGFYVSKYTNENNEEVWLAATQFEAMNARHAFPCFDEPALKATFDIKIEHACSYDAISNGDRVTKDPLT